MHSYSPTTKKREYVTSDCSTYVLPTYRFIELKYRFSKEVREAKRLYSKKFQHQFSANDSAFVWKGFRRLQIVNQYDLN